MERLAFTHEIRRPDATRLRPAPARAAVAATRAPEGDRLAYGALLAFIFALFLRPQDQIPFLSALHLADISGVLAIVALLAGRASRGQPLSRITPELVGVLAFSAVIVATAPLSLWPGGSLSMFTDIFGKIVLIFIVMVNTLTTRERVRSVVGVIALGGTYVGTRAVIDYARGVNLVEGGRIAGVSGGLFGNPNDMALNMAAFLPLAVALILDRERPALRLLGLVAVPAMTGAAIFAKSRGGTVGLLAMLVVLLYQMRRLRPGLAVAAVALVLTALPLLPSSFTERMATIFDSENDPTGSREARKTLLREGYEAFLANPFTGIGAAQFPNYKPEERTQAWRQTHNSVLQVASELGVLGLAVFLFLIWTAFAAGVRALRTARRARGPHRPRAPAGRPFATGPPGPDLLWVEINAVVIIAAVTGWFAAAMFASVAYYWTFYVLLALAGAIRDIAAQTLGAGDRAQGSARAAPQAA